MIGTTDITTLQDGQVIAVRTSATERAGTEYLLLGRVVSVTTDECRERNAHATIDGTRLWCIDGDEVSDRSDVLARERPPTIRYYEAWGLKTPDAIVHREWNEPLPQLVAARKGVEFQIPTPVYGSLGVESYDQASYGEVVTIETGAIADLTTLLDDSEEPPTSYEGNR